jgi:hypothetical protein
VDKSHLLHLVLDFRLFLLANRVCNFVKADHSQVRVSHYLATLARVERHFKLWVGSGPEDILHLLELDQIVTPS